MWANRFLAGISALLLLGALACGAAVASQPVVTAEPSTVTLQTTPIPLELLDPRLRLEADREVAETTVSALDENEALSKLEVRIGELLERIQDLELQNAREHVEKQRSQPAWETVEDCLQETRAVIETRKQEFLTQVRISAFNTQNIRTACSRYLFLQGLSPDVRALISQMGIDAGRRHTGASAVDKHYGDCHSEYKSLGCR